MLRKDNHSERESERFANGSPMSLSYLWFSYFVAEKGNNSFLQMFLRLLKWEIISTRPSHDAWIRTYILTNTFYRLPAWIVACWAKDWEKGRRHGVVILRNNRRHKTTISRRKIVKMWADQVSIRHSLLLLIRFSLNNSLLPSFSSPFEYDLMSYVSNINHQFPILCSRLGSLAFYPIKECECVVLHGWNQKIFLLTTNTNKSKWKGKKILNNSCRSSNASRVSSKKACETIHHVIIEKGITG